MDRCADRHRRTCTARNVGSRLSLRPEHGEQHRLPPRQRRRWANGLDRQLLPWQPAARHHAGPTRTQKRVALRTLNRRVPRYSSGALLPPSPPAEKATACQDKAGQASTRDGPGTGANSPRNKSTPAELGTTVLPNVPEITADRALLGMEKEPTVSTSQKLHGS